MGNEQGFEARHELVVGPCKLMLHRAVQQRVEGGDEEWCGDEERDAATAKVQSQIQL